MTSGKINIMASITQVRLTDTISENRWAAEYFDPKYAFQPNEKYKWIRLGKTFTKCQYGISISMNEKLKGFPIFRMNEINNCVLEKAKKYANIPKAIFEKYKLLPNDVLFNRTNSIDFVGRTGIFKEGEESTFASYLVRVNTNEDLVLPEFLTMYLNTEFGKGQIRRRAMPSINQANVSAAELRRIFIPLVDLVEQNSLKKIFNRSYNLKKESQALYQKATQLLEQELGLDKITFEKPKRYSARFSEVVNSNRADGEFYNPELKNYYKYITETQGRILKPLTYFTKVIKFSNPDYASEGVPIITQKHLTKISPEGYNSFPIASEEWVSKNSAALLRENDLLFYSVGAYLGKTNIWFSDDRAVHASFITMLRCDNKFDAGYLMVLLNSKYGILQSKVYQSGSSQPYIYPKDIRQFLIPDINEDLKKQLYELIRSSYDSKIESQRLLEKAKARVEQLIEEGSQTKVQSSTTA
ncbi:hypothetical protein [Rufibacter roseus]